MYEKLVAFAAEHLELDPSEISPESTFEDLGSDSLDIVERVMELEGELGVDLGSRTRTSRPSARWLPSSSLRSADPLSIS